MVQVFVSGVQGRTLCLSFPHSAAAPLDVSTIHQQIFEREGIPVEEQVLSHNGKPLARCSSPFFFGESGGHPLFLRFGLRLAGGKGGFGSLLRGGDSRVGQKKTTNFDACRDLQGRRLRHANNERKLAEWKAKEAERQYEALGEQYAKQLEKEEEKEGRKGFDELAYQEQLERITQDVTSSLQEGLREAAVRREEEQRKRKREEEEKNNKLKERIQQRAAAKQLAGLWLPEDDDEDDEEDEEEEEEEKEEKEPQRKKNKGKEKEEEKEKEEVATTSSSPTSSPTLSKASLPPLPAFITAQ
ncbi:Autophagy 6 isoform 1 [Balamuthia mandrillaris]